MDVLWILVAIVAVDGVLMAWMLKKLISAKKEPVSALDQQMSLKAWETLHSAIKKSQAIVGEAEIESLKNQSTMIKGVQDFEKKYEGELETTAQQVNKELLVQSAKATEKYKGELESLLKNMAAVTEETKDKFSSNTVLMLTQLGKDLSEKLSQIEAKSIVAAEMEVEAMKKAIAEYRTRRMEKIDTDGVEIVERAVEIVVGKGISVKEQVELINQALDQAKSEKFIN